MKSISTIILLFAATFTPLVCLAQPPGGGQRGGPGRGPGGGRGQQQAAGDASSFIAKLMAYDKDKNGELTKEELDDSRLASLFERADADKNAAVTSKELTAFYEKETANQPAGGFGFGPPPGFGPGGPGGPGGFGGPPGMGPGGRRGFGPPEIGKILPTFVADGLELSEKQRADLAELQKEVDAKLEKILTSEQMQQFKAMRERGPGFPGGGFPGGPPPGSPPGEGAPPSR